MDTQGTKFKDAYFSDEDNAGFLKQIFSKFEFNLDDNLDQEILLYLGCVLKDPSFRARLHDAILKKKIKGSNFDDQVSLLFLDARTKLSMTKETKESFIEEAMQSHEEVNKTVEVLEKNLELLDDTENLGSSVLLEQLMKMSKDKFQLFKTLMGMSADDTDLKQIIFGLVRKGDLADDVHAKNPSDESAILETDRIVDQLVYANDMIRYLVVKEILVGEKGLLLEKDTRHRLLNYLFKFIKPPKSIESVKTMDTLKEVLGVLVEDADTDLLFFVVAPLIHAKIMRKSASETDWNSILLKIGYYDQERVDEVLDNVNQLRLGKTVKVNVHRSDFGDETEEEAELSYTTKLNDLLSAEAAQEAATKWEPEEFVVKLAESIGSPGVRFLQILGQYVALSPELHEAFKNVYDNAKSQSKLTAYHTVKREWQGFETEVSKMVRRIGGGSLMAAYLCEKPNGEKEVLKVLSPNALMQLEFSMRILKSSLHRLSVRNPEKYKLAYSAIGEIEDWIKQDINYNKFLELDKKFKDLHHGKEYVGHDFKVYIPESYPLNQEEKDNRYVKREEFIDGVTLNRLKAEPEERKQIASVIIKNYFEQVISGQVHSDVHPGNFIIFEKNAQKHVAIIDRNNYLELDEKDKTLLLGIQGLASDIKGMADLVAKYFDIKGKNKLTKIRSELKEIFAESGDLVKKAADTMIVLKKEGITIPLKLTLFVKNLMVLNYIATQAGFGSIQGALLFKP